MKRFSFIAVLLLATAALTFNSCDKKPLKVSYNWTQAEMFFTVHATPLSGAIDEMQTATYNIDSFCTANGIKKEQLISFKLNSATFTIIDNTAPMVTFDKLDDCQAQIAKPGDPMKVMAEKSPVPHTGLTELSLDVKDVELADIIKGGTAVVHVTGHTNAPIPHDFTMKVLVTYHIEATLN